MLRWRLLLGALIIATLVGLCWLDDSAGMPGIWLLPVVILFAVLATGEVLHLTEAGGMHAVGWTVYLGNLLLLASNWMPGTGLLLSMPVALGLATGLVFLGEMWRYEKAGGATANIAAAVFALVYVGVMLSFAVELRLAWGLGALASLIIVVKLGDTGAYAVGRLIGRHKMAPVLSPGKTIEGAVGGLVFACLGSYGTFVWLIPAISPETGAVDSWFQWLLFGLLVGAAGMVGDLAESLLKRDVGYKDSSPWLPGFGGVLDILDSILLAAPVAWFCWAQGVVGQ